MTSLTTQDPIRLVQITDSHLYGQAHGTLLNMNTHDSLHQVVNLIRRKEGRIDLILATGDIAQNASPQAYTEFLELIEPLDAPVRWIAGNHDKSWVMQEIGDSINASEKAVRVNRWLLLFLDTSVEGQVHGQLSEEELTFLAESLTSVEADADIDHCLISLHHNPIEGSADWMKEIGLKNAEQFLGLVEGANKVRAVVYGHIHQELDYELDGVRFLCTPSTCIQFKPDATDFALDRMNPGYRTLSLLANGEIDTEVLRVEGSTLEADFSSTGY